jgi:hypothetical protein
MKQKKLGNGTDFKVELKDFYFKTKFIYQSNVVICLLTVNAFSDKFPYTEYEDKIFKGIAKCDQEDTYNKDVGEVIALKKAIDKFDKYNVKRLILQSKYWANLYIDLEKTAQYKLNKIQKKNGQ